MKTRSSALQDIGEAVFVSLANSSFVLCTVRYYLVLRQFVGLTVPCMTGEVLLGSSLGLAAGPYGLRLVRPI